MNKPRIDKDGASSAEARKGRSITRDTTESITSEDLHERAKKELTPEIPTPRWKGVEDIDDRKQRKIETLLKKFLPMLATFLNRRVK